MMMMVTGELTKLPAEAVRSDPLSLTHYLLIVSLFVCLLEMVLT